MKNLKGFEEICEGKDDAPSKHPLPTLTAEEVGAVEEMLEGILGVISEGRIETKNYWPDLDKNINSLMGVLKRSTPSGYKKLKAYMD